jgi:hypothetical protein
MVTVRGTARLQHRRGRSANRHFAERLARPAGQSSERQHCRDYRKPQYTGWCLDKEDLCVAKLCAQREKDRNFVAALLDARLVDAAVIATRLAGVPQTHQAAAEQALKWLEARS